MNDTTTFQDPFQLHGKTVLVTGASSGIGRAIAVECARVGARIIAAGRDGARLDETLAQLQGEGHASFAGDLTDPARIDALVAASGEVDGVVHAAGISALSPMRMLRESFMRNAMDNNFMAPLMLTQKLLYKKALRNQASIVFLSSIAAHTGTVGLSPYAATKAALEAMMRCLALEIAPRGMRANALVPGTVDTPMVRAAPDLLESQAKLYPLGVGRPEDVAYAAIYLLCDASRKVTGTELHLDGGIPWT